jgi:hypothetical protein
MSLAIAVQMLDYTHVEHEEERKDDRWTMDWWLRQANDEASRDAATATQIGRSAVRRRNGT